MWGAKPPPKTGGKAPQFKLFLCLCRWLSRHFSTFYSSHPKPPVPNRAPQACWGLEGFYSSLSRVILLNFKEKYRKNYVEEWFCSSLSRVILVIFIFFRVNDNTMRSYYRYDRLLLSKYCTCMIIIVHMATMVSRQSRPVFSLPRVNICSVSGANRLLALCLHI